MRYFNLFLISLVIGVTTGCGGGSEDSGILVYGTLSQGGESAEHSASTLRHGAGQRIENVQVCGLGRCSTTDEEGQWGFVAPGEFEGGDILITVNGHGINSSLVVEIPSGVDEVSIELENHHGEGVHAHDIVPIFHDTDEEEHQQLEDHDHGDHDHG